MRKWIGVALGLALACTCATLTALPQATGSDAAGDQERKTKRQVIVTGDDQPGRDVRRLAVLGDRGVRIGVSVRDLEGAQADAGTGALVEDVREQSPAAKAGLKAGDVIVDFDGERVRSARHLSRLVGETAPGRTVKTGVLREGKRHDVQVTPEAGGEPMAFSWSGDAPMIHGAPDFRFDRKDFDVDEGAWRDLMNEAHKFGREGGKFDVFIAPGGRGRLGVTLQSLTPQLGEYFGTKDGALVSGVAEDSVAARAGLKAGDVITAVNDKPVASPSDVSRAVSAAEDGSELTIAYTRDRQTATAKVTLEPRKKPARSGQPV